MKQEKAKKRYFYLRKIPGQLRLLLAAVVILAQIGLVFYFAMTMRAKALSLHLALQVLGVLMAIFVVRYQRSAAYSTPWIILLLLFPPVGVILYFLWGRQSVFNKSRRLFMEYLEEQKAGPDAAKSLGQLPKLSKMPSFAAPLVPIRSQLIPPAIKLHEFDSEQDIPPAYYELPLPSRLLTNWGFPIYQGNNCQYFGTGEEQFEAMFKDLAQAKKFIFAEYYIIDEGAIWDEFSRIAIEKSLAGVQVKLLYDDLACAARISQVMLQPLVDAGVEIIRFNPILRYTSRMYINYRNHQKLCLIDGDIAYFSGTNLADEYANLHQPYGYWKDSALKIEGPAAWGALHQFFMMWNLAGGKTPEENSDYLPSALNPLQMTSWDLLLEDDLVLAEGGLTARGEELFKESYGQDYKLSAEYRRALNPHSQLIPFWDGPVNNPHNIGEDLYLALIATAKKSILISTPYFVVDEKFSTALCRAAASGIDVRIMLPGIPDKWTVNQTTKASYEQLLRSGVRVFEYSPGFNHDKIIVVDGEMAVTGSLNFDFRSFNLNYENGCYLYQHPVIKKIEEDLLKSISLSHEVCISEWLNRPFYLRILQEVLRIFAPLI
ncbi:MAG: phospholipase D-like domain-containing protein [Eubacteriales bacterium]|nr:phospholipase D-like domain-containing protein [Eubacteriales bacterium]